MDPAASGRRRRRCGVSRDVVRVDGALTSSTEALWQMSTLIDRYEAVLDAAPLATKCVTSWVGFTVADAVAQGLALGPLKERNAADASEGEGAKARYDISRTLRMGIFGLAFYGPISGAWYGALDQWVLPDDPAGAAAVAAKTTLDQVMWAPVLITSLFAWWGGAT